jgi:hypothetical protein
VIFKRTGRRVPVAVLMAASALAGGVIVISATALASIPDANGTYHACVNNVTGAVRIIDPSIKNNTYLSS